jgi:hypothetical protein
MTLIDLRSDPVTRANHAARPAKARAGLVCDDAGHFICLEAARCP